MAQLQPDYIEFLESAPAGEKEVFRFLHAAVWPDKDFIAWYEPIFRFVAWLAEEAGIPTRWVSEEVRARNSSTSPPTWINWLARTGSFARTRSGTSDKTIGFLWP